MPIFCVDSWFALSLLWGVTTLTFLLVHVVPGDPVDLMTDPQMSPADVAQLRQKLGLDDSLVVQYLRWLAAVAQGDLGISLHQQRPVRQILGEAIPMTLRLSVLALLLHYVTGTVLGVFAATRRGEWGGRGDRRGGVGTLLDSGLLARGSCSNSSSATGCDGYPAGAWATFLRLEPLRDVVGRSVPTHGPAALRPGLSGSAAVARFMRGSMIEALHEDFVRTARSKGLRRGRCSGSMRFATPRSRW